MPTFRVDVVHTADELQAALAIRRLVFIEEQDVPPAEELDRFDTETALNTDAVHLLGRLDGEVIATARLLLALDAHGLPHIGRVAVLAPEREHGYGTAIMDALHSEARARGFAGTTLAAQVHAIGFYEKLGYVAYGETFLDAGIEHRQMDLRFA